MVEYAAFISYRRGDLDERVARRLQRRLENYRLPPAVREAQGKATVGTVFLDTSELGAAPSLGDALTAAIVSSERLVVVVSERSAQSRWVVEEMRTFAEAVGRPSIAYVVVDGDPAVTLARIQGLAFGDDDPPEPVAVDVRGATVSEVVVLKETLTALHCRSRG